MTQHLVYTIEIIFMERVRKLNYISISEVAINNFIVFVLLMLISTWSQAQTKPFPKTAFAGRWEYAQKHNNLVLLIKFEKGKNYATVVDVGTGEAPSIQFKAQMQGDQLVINPQTHLNDFYIQLNVKNNKLLFKTQIAIWGRDGKPLPPKKDGYTVRIYKKVK